MAINKISQKYLDNDASWLPLNTVGEKVNEVIDALNDITDGTGTETFENITVTDTASVDTISENTAATGVTVDGVLLKDSTVLVADGTDAAPSIKVGVSNTGLFGGFGNLNFAVLGVQQLSLGETGATFNNPAIFNEDITITGVIINVPDTRTGAGAISITTSFTKLVTTGANALTLANGATEGQIKIISMTTDGGDGTLIPASRVGFASIVFNDIGDSISLIYTTGGWVITANNGCTVS